VEKARRFVVMTFSNRVGLRNQIPDYSFLHLPPLLEKRWAELGREVHLVVAHGQGDQRRPEELNRYQARLRDSGLIVHWQAPDKNWPGSGTALSSGLASGI
jgi:hypothetical protein